MARKPKTEWNAEQAGACAVRMKSPWSSIIHEDQEYVADGDGFVTVPIDARAALKQLGCEE